MLAEEAGDQPGALGATAHGAVSQKMCKYIGGYEALVKHLGELRGSHDRGPTTFETKRT